MLKLLFTNYFMQPQEKVLKRIEQSFFFLIKNKEIILWFSIIYILMYIVWVSIFKYILNSIVFDTNFLSHSQNIVWLIILWVYILLAIILQIWFALWWIKYIKENRESRQIDFLESLKYGFNHIFRSFITYYYIFLYVYIIPLGLLIIWLILLLLEQTNILKTWATWWIVIWVSTMLLVIFSIYRWVKSVFAIYSAIDNEKYDKNSFEWAIKITENKWWRIFWNGLLLWLIVWLLSSLINQFFWAIDPMYNFSEISWKKDFNIKDFKIMMNSVFSIRISWIVSALLQGLIFTFSATFYYIFYKRLEYEFESANNLIEEEKINLSENKVEKEKL